MYKPAAYICCREVCQGDLYSIFLSINAMLLDKLDVFEVGSEGCPIYTEQRHYDKCRGHDLFISYGGSPAAVGYTQAYVQIMQHTHMYKAATGRVEAKKLLPRRR